MKKHALLSPIIVVLGSANSNERFDKKPIKSINHHKNPSSASITISLMLSNLHTNTSFNSSGITYDKSLLNYKGHYLCIGLISITGRDLAYNINGTQ